MKQKYDIIFGLGPVCSCTQCLRYAGLQLQSFPYDWICHYREEDRNSPETPTYDLPVRANTISDDFADWFNPEDFVKDGSCKETGKDWYHNTKLKLIVLHDFPIDSKFDAAYPLVLAKYKRRIARLLGLIRRSRRALVLRLDRPGLGVSTPTEDCRSAVRTLSQKFPGVHFDLLLLQHLDGVPIDALHETRLPDNVTVVQFDYHSENPDAVPNSPNFALVSDFLRSRYRVRDYRTVAERLAKWRSSLARRIKRLRMKLSART